MAAAAQASATAPASAGRRNARESRPQPASAQAPPRLAPWLFARQRLQRNISIADNACGLARPARMRSSICPGPRTAPLISFSNMRAAKAGMRDIAPSGMRATCPHRTKSRGNQAGTGMHVGEHRHQASFHAGDVPSHPGAGGRGVALPIRAGSAGLVSITRRWPPGVSPCARHDADSSRPPRWARGPAGMIHADPVGKAPSMRARPGGRQRARQRQRDTPASAPFPASCVKPCIARDASRHASSSRPRFAGLPYTTRTYPGDMEARNADGQAARSPASRRTAAPAGCARGAAPAAARRAACELGSGFS